MLDRRLLCFLLVTATPLLPRGGANAAGLDVGAFSRQPAGVVVPEGWERWLAAEPGLLTRWKLVTGESGATELRAIANASSSGLVRRVTADLEATPMLVWSWRALEEPGGADLATAGRDDAAARVCALFAARADQAAEAAAEPTLGAALPVLPGEPVAQYALCYAWATSGDEGSVVSSPSSPRARAIIARAGKALRSVEERRDLAADFERAFDSEPGPLIAIGLLSDSDGTKGFASAYFGDVTLQPR